MDPLFIYLCGLAVLVLIIALVMSVFSQHRFQGDQTINLFLIFALLCIISVIATVSFLSATQVAPTPDLQF
jgi:hypothetical protein